MDSLSDNPKTTAKNARRSADHPFRSAVFRGLGVFLPPLLTIVIFLWVGGTVQQYVLRPVTSGARNALVWAIADVRHEDEVRPKDRPQYRHLKDGTYVPLAVYRLVKERDGTAEILADGDKLYRRYVELRYLPWYLIIPFFLSVFVILLYLLGKFIAAGIGRFFWGLVERVIHQVPLVRNVYSSVKQVSDFLLSQEEIEYNRVVAVEYPRKGIWSLGMVTGESMLDIRSAANEPVLSLLIPTSPAPFTGFTVTVLKSETIDLNITIDQAFQFIVSCGVVIPSQQMQKMIEGAAASESSDAHSPPIMAADEKQAAGTQ